jgi:hypothetical protein
VWTLKTIASQSAAVQAAITADSAINGMFAISTVDTAKYWERQRNSTDISMMWFIPIAERAKIMDFTTSLGIYDAAVGFAKAVEISTLLNSRLSFPAGIIHISTPQNIPCSTIGQDKQKTIIRALSGSSSLTNASLLTYTVANSSHFGYTVDGNATAKYAGSSNGAALSKFDVDFILARLDGFYGAASGNNNSISFTDAQFRNNGTTHSSITGFNAGNVIQNSIAGNTVSGTAGGNTYAITGGFNPSTIQYPIRPGIDTLKVVGQSAKTISSVTSTTITINETIVGTVTAQQFAICQGNGEFTENHSDNNTWNFTNCAFVASATSGRVDHAAKMATDTNSNYEFCGTYDGVIGKRFPPLGGSGSTIISPYNEGGAASEGSFYYANAQNAILITPKVLGTEARCKIDNASSVKYIGYDDIQPVLDVSGLGAGTYDIVAPNSLFNQSGGAANVTVRLPLAPKSLIFPENYTMNLGAMNGKTFTVITASAGVTINSVAGTTGVTFSGSFKTLVATWNPGSSGWAISQSA